MFATTKIRRIDQSDPILTLAPDVMSAQDTAAGAVIPRLMLRMNQPAPLLSKVLIALLHYLNSAAYWTTAGESVPPQSTPVKLRGGSFCPAWQASVVYEEVCTVSRF